MLPIFWWVWVSIGIQDLGFRVEAVVAAQVGQDKGHKGPALIHLGLFWGFLGKVWDLIPS